MSLPMVMATKTARRRLIIQYERFCNESEVFKKWVGFYFEKHP